MSTRRTLTTPRRLLAGTVLCALLLTQALGLLHRLLHAHGPALTPHAQLARDPATPEQRELKSLFAQHQAAQDCQLFDQLTQLGVPGFAMVAMGAEPIAEPRCAIGAAPHLVTRDPGNLARGPPTRA